MEGISLSSTSSHITSVVTNEGSLQLTRVFLETIFLGLISPVALLCDDVCMCLVRCCLVLKELLHVWQVRDELRSAAIALFFEQDMRWRSKLSFLPNCFKQMVHWITTRFLWILDLCLLRAWRFVNTASQCSHLRMMFDCMLSVEN